MARLAPALLPHVNLLLCMLAGGALSTAARLRWDPVLRVPLRALAPAEYRLVLAALAAAPAAVLLAAALAAAALQLRRRSPLRAALLLTSATLQAGVWAGLWAGGAWLWTAAARWLRSAEAARAREALEELRLHARPLLALAARYVPPAPAVAALLEEAAEDAPCNLWVAAGGLLAGMLLLPLAASLAMLAACPAPRPAPVSTEEKTPLRAPETPRRERAAYRGGRLVMLP